MDKLNALLNALRDVLQGEPLRAITYGSAVVIYLVARALGSIPDQSLDQALVSAGAAAAIIIGITEAARNFVYSPKTVEAIAAGAPVAAVDGAAVPVIDNPDA